MGGVTKASNMLGVSNQAVHKWKSRGVMPTDSPEARARLLKMSESTYIEPLALIGLTGPAPSNGGDSDKVKPLRPGTISRTAS